MAEINRVYTAVEAFFDASGREKIDELGGIIGATARKAERRIHEKAREFGRERFEKLQKDYDAFNERLTEAVGNCPTISKEENIKIFQKLAKDAMVLRRATYPLNNPEASYLPDLEPEEALMDDNDTYAFAIFDTLAEDIQFILPALFGLACEGDDFEGVEPPV